MYLDTAVPGPYPKEYFMKNVVAGLAVILAFVAAASPHTFGQKLKPEEIVAKHLDSIGTAEARAAVKNRMVVEMVTVTFVSQKNQKAEGRVVLVSTDAKNFFGMQLNSTDYAGEKFTFDGKKSFVGFANNGIRSVLGNFVLSNDWIVEESLLGGTLAHSWALMASGKGKLSGGGTKKIDGKEVYVLGYSRKGGSDIDVSLYFDKETFRHVRTEYKRTSSAVIGTNPNQSSGFSETRYRLAEDFGNFKTVNGLTLPHSYKVHYLASGQRGTSEVEWNFDLSEFAFNQNLDESTFVGEAK